MKKSTTILLFVMVLSLSGYSQIMHWSHHYGASEVDRLSALKQTSDGGFILGGSSNSQAAFNKTENSKGGYDMWVIKVNPTGTIQWQNTIGGSQNDFLTSLEQTTDGGYILAGYSNSNISGDKTENRKGRNDFWIVKLNSTGDIIWQKTIGGNLEDRAHSIKQTNDGGYIIGGRSNSIASGDKSEDRIGQYDVWIVKIDALGNIEWENTIGGHQSDVLNAIHQTTDGGYIAGCLSYSGISGDKTEGNRGSSDYWILKLDNAGFIEWQKTIGGDDYECLNSIKQTADGGYIIGGFSNSDVSGDKTEASKGGADYWLIKIDPTGTLLWQKVIGGGGDDMLYAAEELSTGEYILGGYSSSGISGDKTESNQESDYWVILTDNLGNVQWQKTYGGDGIDELSTSQPTSDGGIVMGGSSFSWGNSNGNFDYWVVKIFPISTGIIDVNEASSLFELYPSLASGYVTLSLKGMGSDNVIVELVNDVGQLIKVLYNGQVAKDGIKMEVDISALSNGVYFVSMKGHRKEVLRFVKE